MAVTMVSKQQMKSTYPFLQKVGISNLLIQDIDNADIQVHLGFFDMQLVGPGGDVLASIKLAKSTNDMMKDNVPDSIMAAIKGTIEKAIHKALNMELAEGDKFDTMLDELGEEAAEWKPDPQAKHVEPEPKVETANQPAFQSGAAMLSPEKVIKGEVVPLKEATFLYQPVKGTSNGSRYFVVAIGDGVKVAARMKGSSISIRVEGEGLTSKVKANFASVALEDKGEYMSGHFETGNSTSLRVVGAVLLGSGVDFKTPMPNLNYINGKGA